MRFRALLHAGIIIVAMDQAVLLVVVTPARLEPYVVPIALPLPLPPSLLLLLLLPLAAEASLPCTMELPFKFVGDFWKSWPNLDRIVQIYNTYGPKYHGHLAAAAAAAEPEEQELHHRYQRYHRRPC